MPRFFMNLHSRHEDIIDPEGVEIATDKIAFVALTAARDCIAGDVAAGKLELDCRLEVLDADGRLAHSLSFADALDISDATKRLFLT